MMSLAFWVLMATGPNPNPWTHDHLFVFQIGETQEDCQKAAKKFPAAQHARCAPVFGDQLDHLWYPHDDSRDFHDPFTPSSRER